MKPTARALLRAVSGALAAWLLGACVGGRGEADVNSVQEATETMAPDGPWEESRARRGAMGTWFEVRVWHRPEAPVQPALDAVWVEIERVEQALSDYRPESEARSLEGGAWQQPSAILAEALCWGERLVRETGGACDPTVGPLTRLWRRAARQGELPTSARVSAARAAVGWSGVERAEDGAVRLSRPGMRLDFGAFGKGLALDRGYAVLAEAGFPSALLDGGGDLRIGQPPPGRAGWEVTVEGRPGDRQVLTLACAGLATSGLSGRPLVLEGQVLGHILDPRTGAWLDLPRAASCRAPTAAQADGWATALCLAGAGALETLPEGVEGRVLEPVGDAFRNRVSPGFLAEAPAITAP